MKTFFWDFFGPRADGTAEHFLRHLRVFLEQHECPEMPLGLRSEGAGHRAVFCTPPPEFELAIERSLKPRRSSDE
ncbi:MAG TPA: hypothetical protein VHV51_09870 [Polyangiaceae bacterium]|jgi:hypothetical protein|nr:hypothetical protein [Polyangiaceae bacterium]